MAQLQLALYTHVDSVVASPGLPLIGQERYHSKPLGHQTQLEHLKNNFQQQFLHDKEERLKGLCTHEAQSYSRSLSAGSKQQDPGQASFYSAGPHSRYPTNQANTLPCKWIARRRGVDRSYPLKPVFYRKAGSVPVTSAGQLRSPQVMEGSPSSRSSSANKGNFTTARALLDTEASPWSADPKHSASHLDRPELGYIQRLEAAGQSMEVEIRRKEALLWEKLKRTEEELRRIQREREQVEVEERKATGVPTEARKMPERKENVCRATTRPSEGCYNQGQSPEGASLMTGISFLPWELGMERLKKERLVASNNKIRDHIPLESLASRPELVLNYSQAPSAAALSHQDLSHYQAAEPLYVQAPTAAEQGELGQCGLCRRQFLCFRLEKHMNICSKNQGSKRKVFDSSKARAKGTELEQFRQWKASDIPQDEPPQTNNWRQKHEYFIRTLRQARQVQQVLSRGGKLSDLPPLSPVENPDYVSCPHCSRRFAPKVAERHIPKCKTIKNRPPPPPQRRRC
ncbi:PREDICTED: zinc finger C2HC domain-containing protein 1C isoform X1 [Crocodylus porosus]|uniref:Zinc finger C2HC-type containing 1C n=2 Tax=Crocodylus porosus TaxID=8502 RepID=A0A7M4EAW1_CROPO|nr:PREDICTED: zinc finger C2HC domain-containing protein 1C isoform X1 [Crocodylus porosus]